MHFTNKEKARWLKQWRQSSKSAWTFAKENGLVPQTFCRWTKSGLKMKQGFVELKAQEIPSVQRTSGILIEKGDVKIHIPLGPGLEELRAVMAGLGGAS